MMAWQLDRLKRDYLLYAQEMDTLLSMEPRHPCAGIEHLSQYIQETAQKLMAHDIDPLKLRGDLGTAQWGVWGGNVATQETPAPVSAPESSPVTPSYTVPENVTLTENEGAVFAQVALAGTRAFIGQFDSMPAAIRGVKRFFLTNKPYLIAGEPTPQKTAKNHDFCKSPGCQARITWLKTVTGSSMPVDDWVRVPGGQWEKSMGSHFETCPEAKEWRAK